MYFKINPFIVAGLIGTVTTEKDGLWPASKAFYNNFSSLKVATFKPLSSACFILYTINPYNYGFAALIDFNFSDTTIFAKYKVLYGDVTTMLNLKIGYTNNNDEVILYISRPSVTFNIMCLGKTDGVKLEYIKTPNIPSNLTVLDKYD